MNILRGTARVIAAATGLLLVYGTIYALEGMTTRIPVAATRELVMESFWTAPWMLLFCSGVEDLALAVHKKWLIWIGAVVALLFLYYFDWHTSLSFLTKAAMPPLALGAGLVPYFVKQIRFVFVLSSVAAGVAGVYVLYLVGNTVWFPTTHFANKFIGLVILAFAGASIVAALLAVFEVYRKLTRRVYA